MQPYNQLHHSENGHLNLDIMALDLDGMEELYESLFDEVKTKVNIPTHLFYKLKDLFINISVNIDSIKIINLRIPIDEERVERFLNINRIAFKEIIRIFIELEIALPEQAKKLSQDLE